MNIRGIVCNALCTALLLSLAGCAEPPEFIENYAMEHAGIMQNEDYQSYQNMQNEDKLDENGHYQGDETIELEEIELPEGDVKISFAKNSCLDVEYFSDAACTQPIKGSVWFMNAGDSVYAKTPESKVEFSDFYEFDRFLLYTYDSSGARSAFTQENTEDWLVLRIPEGWDGTAFSVVPMGRYLDRTIQLDDNMETDGTRSELHGKWTVNGKQTTDSEISVSPVSSCIIDYEYDPERYHVAEIYPEQAFQMDGFIRFESVSGIDKISVKLAPYEKIDLRIVLDDSVKNILLDMVTADVNENLRYDNKAEKDGSGRIAFDGRELTGGAVLEKKSEVTVTIKPKDGYYVTGSNENSGAYSETMKFEKWEKDQQKILAAHPIQKAIRVTLDSADEHGLCVYKLDGETVSGKVKLEDGQKLEITYSLTDEEYEIDRGWWNPNRYFSGGSKTASITVSAELDGKTLSPADFGIELKNKED